MDGHGEQALDREANVCPYIEKDDVRCADHLTMRNVAHAFAHCADNYAQCPVYQRLKAQQGRYEPAYAARLLVAS